MVGSPIGGFMPIPLAMMIPFMATQSMVMGDAFGRSYQYGKRKISAMTNEEFNALTPEMLTQEILSQYKNMIPHLKQSIQDSTDLQNYIVEKLIAMPGQLLQDTAERISDTISGKNTATNSSGQTYEQYTKPPPTVSQQPRATKTTPKPTTTVQKYVDTSLPPKTGKPNQTGITASRVAIQNKEKELKKLLETISNQGTTSFREADKARLVSQLYQMRVAHRIRYEEWI